MGYILTRHTDRQEFYIFRGRRKNGKSTLINIITHMLGSLWVGLLQGTLFEKCSYTPADLARMRGKRLAVGAEKESKFRLISPVVKAITGEHTLPIMEKYEAPYDMKVTAKLVIICNKKPKLDVLDDALKERVRFIPFDYFIPPEKRIKDFDKKLLAEEASGILTFMLEGTKVYMSDAISEPKSITRAKADYYSEQDSVRCFVDDRCVKDPSASVARGELFDEYQRYCEDELLEPLNQRDFKQSMERLDFQQHRTESQRLWRGLRLMEAEEGSEARRYLRLVEKSNRSSRRFQ
jgi:putative DNA primase/helicase